MFCQTSHWAGFLVAFLATFSLDQLPGEENASQRYNASCFPKPKTSIYQPNQPTVFSVFRTFRNQEEAGLMFLIFAQPSECIVEVNVQELISQQLDGSNVLIPHSFSIFFSGGCWTGVEHSIPKFLNPQIPKNQPKNPWQRTKVFVSFGNSRLKNSSSHILVTGIQDFWGFRSLHWRFENTCGLGW